MGQERMDARMWRELTWEVPKGWEKARSRASSGWTGRQIWGPICSQTSLQSPGRFWRKPFCKPCPGIWKTRKQLRTTSSQMANCDNNLTACSEDMAGMVGKGRAVVIYLDFPKACYMISLQPKWSDMDLRSELQSKWTAGCTISLQELWSVVQSPTGGYFLVVSIRSQYWHKHSLILSRRQWDETYPHHRCHPSKGAINMLEGRAANQFGRNLWNVSPGKCKFLNLGVHESMSQDRWGTNWPQSIFAVKFLGGSQQTTTPTQVSRASWGSATSWAVLTGVEPAGWGKWFLPSAWCFVRPYLEDCVLFWIPLYKMDIEILEWDC